MVERKQLRQKNQFKRELEQAPDCLYDVKKLEVCQNYEFPPEFDSCRACLVRNLTEAFESRDGAAAMAYFLGYLSFVDANYVLKDSISNCESHGGKIE